ncbi:MAG: hypothetical protein ACI88A_004034 [Paraglaciecola sp.]|jgi:hypothetical protein
MDVSALVQVGALIVSLLAVLFPIIANTRNKSYVKNPRKF